MTSIIFMGTPDFSANVLKYLINKDYQILAVVTQPDRPVGRKRKLTASPTKQLALNYDLPIYQPEKLSNSPEMDALLELKPDFIVTAAYGQYIPTKLLALPNYLAVNVHASLLPKYRGAAPIQYAIWHAEEETGVTIMEMVKEMDAGDILSQASIKITAEDDAGSLFEKLSHLGAQLLIDTLPKIKAGEVIPSVQDEEQVTYSPMLKREEEQIDWKQTAQAIRHHIYAFRPNPSTYSWLDDKRVKIWDGYPFEDAKINGKVGEILAIEDDAIVVQAGSQTLFAITEWQESGKKRMTIAQALNGLKQDELIGKTFEFQAR